MEKAWLKKETITFYDSVTGKPLFKAPVGRNAKLFIKESKEHGWPSFRDKEVVWDNVRCIKNEDVKLGDEVVSTTGTHLGHNYPDVDKKGKKPPVNRYSISVISIAG